MKTRGDLLRFALAFALMRARKLVRGLPPGAQRRGALPRRRRRGSPIAAARRPLGLVARATADDRQGIFDATNGQGIVRLSALPRKQPSANSGANVAMGLVSRVTPVHTAMRNCTRDEGRSFEVGNQVLISSHRKLLSSKAMVVNVAEKPKQDSGRHDWERRTQVNRR
jgi:hypothetical protein